MSRSLAILCFTIAIGCSKQPAPGPAIGLAADAGADASQPDGGACWSTGLAPISRVGRALYANGQPWRFLGYNLWSEAWPSAANLPNAGNVKYYPSSVDKVGADFARIRALGMRAVRMFLLQSMVPYDGVTDTFDWTSFDAVVGAATANELYLIVALSDGNNAGEPAWKTLPDGGAVVLKARDWYSPDDGGVAPFERAGQYPKSYLAWAQTVASHVKGNGTIAWFELQNEPHVQDEDGSCTESSSATAEGAGEVLRRFVDVTGAAVKAVDPCRLISLATIGTRGDCGSKDGPYTYCHQLDSSCTSDWQYVNESPAIDLVNLHDYSYHYPADPTQRAQFYVGWTDDNHVRLAEANHIGKPLYVGEIGMYAPPSTLTQCAASGRVETYPAGCSDRVGCFDLKLSAVLGPAAPSEARPVGALAWQATSGVSGLTGDCFSVGTTADGGVDPLDAVLAKHAP
jgi:hypothetical protein